MKFMRRDFPPLLLMLFIGLFTACEIGTGDDDTGLDADGDGYTVEEGDCDDEDAAIYPGAEEIPYDGIDQDCNDEDTTDVDWDGYDAEEAGGDDCDDEDTFTYPGAEEIPYDGIDQDCDGEDIIDVDGDEYIGEEAGGDDCDDGDPDVNPGAEEVPEDGIDNDCDGSVDESPIGSIQYIHWPEDAYGSEAIVYFLAIFADTIGDSPDPFMELAVFGIPYPSLPSPGSVEYIEYGSLTPWDYGSATFYSAGDSIIAEGPSSSLRVRVTADPPLIYYFTSTTPRYFEAGEVYTLSADGEDISAFSEDALFLPEEFPVTYPDPMEPGYEVMKHSDLEITWTPNPSSNMESLVVANLVSTSTGDMVYGVEYDDTGSLIIPYEYLENFDNGTHYLFIGKLIRNTMLLAEGEVEVWGKVEYRTYPEITGYFTLDPSSGTKGETLDVVVDANVASFADGVTTADFGTGVTVNSVSVTDSTLASVNITIGMDAETGANDVSMTTGSEVLTEIDAFAIEPAIFCDPGAGLAGETLDVRVTSLIGGFSEGTTADFGSEITVNSVTFRTESRVIVNVTIDPSAAPGGRRVAMTTGSSVIYEDEAFHVMEELPALDTCADADAFGSLPSGYYFGDTSRLRNDYDFVTSSCTGYSAGGNDAAYRVDLVEGDSIEVSLTFETMDTSLYMVTDCSDVEGSCVAGADATLGGEEEAITYTVPAGGEGAYYIIVDSYDSGGGEFTLVIDY